nr:replication associated protein [Banfec virus 2]
MDQNIRREERLTNVRAMRWVITWNNPPKDWQNHFQQVFDNDHYKVKYLIGGSEHENEGTHHIQGFIKFDKQVYRNTVNAILQRNGINCWFEDAKGSDKDCILYCRKENKFREWGDAGDKELAKDLKRERELQKLNDILTLDDEELEQKYPMWFFNNYGKIQEYRMRKNIGVEEWNGDLKEKNVWIWGRPGTGKSRWARRQGTFETTYPKMANKWWNGFNPLKHTNVIIDDFPRDGKAFVQLMKLWSDRYTFLAEVKGASVKVQPGNFNLIVTSNYSIDDTFAGDEAAIEAIKRRFKEVEIFNRSDIFLSTKLKKPSYKDDQENSEYVEKDDSEEEIQREEEDQREVQLARELEELLGNE